MKPIPISNATADYFASEDYAPTNAIDGDPRTRWGGAGSQGRPHQAIFAFESPVQSPDADLIVFMTGMKFGGAQNDGE